MTFRNLLKRIAYILIDVPLVGRVVVMLLKIRRKIISGDQNINLKETERANHMQYYDDALKGILECLQRHENKFNDIEDQLKELTGNVQKNRK